MAIAGYLLRSIFEAVMHRAEAMSARSSGRGGLLPNKPLKLTAAGFSCAGSHARHDSW
jgi:hypothetical protein